MKRRDVIGVRFGRYVVLSDEPNRKRIRYVRARCDCGVEKSVRVSSLVSGAIVSCGCYNREKLTKHGRSDHKLYPLWKAMFRRCERESDSEYHNYGKRGISVCEQWRSFDVFLNDVGDRPSSKHTLDRIDTNGNYEPSNVHWVTQKEQQRNRRNNRLIEFDGEVNCLAYWAEYYGLSVTTLWARLKKGWSVERALLTPLR